jgi:PDZ domain-containing secreted protein
MYTHKIKHKIEDIITIRREDYIKAMNFQFLISTWLIQYWFFSTPKQVEQKKKTEKECRTKQPADTKQSKESFIT